MNIIKLFTGMVALVAFTGCSAIRHSALNYNQPQTLLKTEADRRLADTLIKKAVENEGLYTVTGRLKPMSSVTEMYLRLTDSDSTKRGNRFITDTTTADFARLKQYQRVVNALNFGDLRFIISPFKATDKYRRILQVSVYRQSLVDSLIHAQQRFFGQFGFVPGSNAAVVINTVEYENRYDRYRGYGYLFGYPESAVDFFTTASKEMDKTKTFVKREFLQIPVYSSVKGRFVYAVPPGYIKDSNDNQITERAAYWLERFKRERNASVRTDGTVDYYGLLQRLMRQ